MDKIKFEEQEVDGILFDGSLKQAVEIIEHINNNPTSVFVNAKIEGIESGLNDVVIHFIVSNTKLLNQDGSPMNTVYFQAGKGEIILFAKGVVTVLNHRLVEPLNVKVESDNQPIPIIGIESSDDENPFAGMSEEEILHEEEADFKHNEYD